VGQVSLQDQRTQQQQVQLYLIFDMLAYFRVPNVLGGRPNFNPSQSMVKIGSNGTFQSTKHVTEAPVPSKSSKSYHMQRPTWIGVDLASRDR